MVNDVWNNQESLKSLIDNVLRETRTLGASSAEIDVGVNKGFTVTVRMGEVESIEYNQDKILEITVYFGQRMGAASISDFRPEAIHAAVKAACNIARFTDQDIYSGLADKDLLKMTYPDLDLHHPWDLSVNQAIELALSCEQEALAKDKRIINSEGASIATTNGWHGYGNSNGFIGCYPSSVHEISCALIAKKGEEMQRDFSYTLAADPALLKSIHSIAEEAADRTIKRLGAKQLTTRKVPVIFAADKARSLLGHFTSAISGGNLYRKSSFLLDRLGDKIFPEHITLDQRPHLAKMLASVPFDDDGIVTRPNVFVKNGILNMYSLGVYSARKLGLETTANAGGVFNLFINTGNKNLTELLKTMDTGLLVTDLMGQGVNLITGDYSRGASGFWVEGGQIQYPVEEITIAGNLNEMYSQIIEIGNDIDTRGNIQTGSILIENMTVAGEG